MKKRRRKTTKCLNCGLSLKESFDYCPGCGQENTDNQLSFGRLVVDFFSNYFSLDSRFGRSVKPFFFQPGVLTQAFMEGKRIKYANPIRLYLVISLIHFFFFSINMDRKSDDNQGILKNVNTQTPAETPPTPSDSSEEESKVWPFSSGEVSTIQAMLADKEADYTVAQVEDSIKNGQKPFVPRYLTRQLIKLMKSDIKSINNHIVKNIPLGMFFILPVFALLLKLLFRKRLYINHLVHTLHLHSFSFTVLTLLWVLGIISPSLAEHIDFLFTLIILVYMVLSFRTVYGLKILTAIWKVALSGFLYVILLSISMIFGVLVSLLFY